MNQSSLYRLRWEGRGGEGGAFFTGGPSGQGFEVARGAQDDGRLALLVFRGGLHLVAREFEDDAIALAGCGNEMQRLPVDGDLAIANAEKPAEVDDGGAHPAIIDFGGFLGVGNRKIAVDWKALHFVPAAGKRYGVVLELTRDQVKAAPEYKEGKPTIVLGASGNLEPLP